MLSLLALSFAEVAALFPLATVLGFAALLLKRWWTQQDNAMAAAIEASNKEGARCEERLAAQKAEAEKDMAELRAEQERLRVVVRELMPIVPPEAQAKLWNLMWMGSDAPSRT